MSYPTPTPSKSTPRPVTLKSTRILQATGVSFVKDDKFSLGDLLNLGLHNYVDACSEIVDRAQKELNIEKALEKIGATWAGLSLTFSPYQESEVFQFNADEAITEALEADNLLLQNMSGGKYVQVWPSLLSPLHCIKCCLGVLLRGVA